MKWECTNTHTKYTKLWLKWKIKLLQLVLRITRLRSRRASKDRTFGGSIELDVKSIHLALEVKTFFNNSTPAMGLNMESSSQKPGLSTASHQRHRRKRGKKKPAHKRLQSKAWATMLSKIGPIWPCSQLLDMQGFKWWMIHKPTVTSSNHF
jgi:hypothetical protein